jgi:predicted GNAT superfamily acetyltransferase
VLTAAAVLAEAGLTVSPLDSLSTVRQAEGLFARIWQAPGTPPMTAETMRAVEHAGGYVVGVWSGARLVGASAGFLAIGPDRDVRLHSHITGVLHEAQGGQVGWALKQHQRSWALERGIDTITWTFDPLVRRNAWFNLVKLGAEGVEYLVDFYGVIHDGINAGEPTDRVFCRWDLRSPVVVSAAEGHPRVVPAVGAPVVLDEHDGRPHPVGPGAPQGPVRLRLPADIERLRKVQPEVARAWRHAVRDVLGPLLDAGRRTAGMTADGDLVVGAPPRGGPVDPHVAP